MFVETDIKLDKLFVIHPWYLSSQFVFQTFKKNGNRNIIFILKKCDDINPWYQWLLIPGLKVNVRLPEITRMISPHTDPNFKQWVWLTGKIQNTIESLTVMSVAACVCHDISGGVSHRFLRHGPGGSWRIETARHPDDHPPGDHEENHQELNNKLQHWRHWTLSLTVVSRLLILSEDNRFVNYLLSGSQKNGFVFRMISIAISPYRHKNLRVIFLFELC